MGPRRETELRCAQAGVGEYKEGLCSTEAPGAGLLQQSPQQDGERHGGLDHRLGGIWLCIWSASPGKLLIWVQIPNTDTLLLCPHRNLLEKENGV